jgi:NitT/TauT family transport system permease protein
MSVVARSYSRAPVAYWLQRAFPATAAFILLLILWQATTVVFHVPSYTLPSPTDIAVVMIDQWQSLVENSFVTLLESAGGLCLSIAIGVPLGILIVYFPAFERIFYPFLVASQAIPKVALAPILVVWLGFGLLPKVLIAFFIAFFPIVMNTVAGISRTPPEMIHLMRSLGASPLQILMRIQLPSASPYIFAGIKVAAAFAVVGAIVGEFIAANSGLGYLQLVADNNFQIPLLFATLVVLSLMGIALFYLVSLVEMLVLPPPLRQIRIDDGSATL